MDAIEPLRHAARQLVRELNVLDTRHCIEGFSFSECHLITELQNMGQGTASELSECLLLEKSTISRLCNALLERGFLKAVRDGSDRRRRLLSLSEKGQKGAERIHSYARRQVGGALEFIAEKEQPYIVSGLDRYAKALRYARLSKAYSFRPIRKSDNAVVGGIIRQVMTEFGAVGRGYSIEDPEVDDMYGAYKSPTAAFFVVEKKGLVHPI